MLVWKEIPGFPGYDVSCVGQVRSWRKRGAGDRRRQEPLLLKQHDLKGYKSVLLMRDAKSTRVQVRRAVLLAFIGPPLGTKTDVDHLDDDRGNNKPENLEWVTKQENIARMVRRGRQARGEKINTAKLTRAAVGEIRARMKAVEEELSLQYGVGVTHIRAVYRGSQWKHLVSHWTETEEGVKQEEGFRALLRERLPALTEAAQNDRTASWREIAKRAGVDVPMGRGGVVANMLRDNARRPGVEYPTRRKK